LIHVEEAGNITTVPSVFLHGWPESWSSWPQVMVTEVDDDLLRDVTGILTSLYGRRAAANRVQRTVAAITGAPVR